MSLPEITRQGSPPTSGDGQELSEEDLEVIREFFYEKIVPKLQRLDARLGNIECSFAGEKYRNWVLTFRSSGSEFEIVEIEYDPEADTFDLDL